MIISASYRTDIPAFYGDWFIARLETGYCHTVNPYNQQIYPIRLDREAVSGFVFWTKSLHPFYPKLQLMRDRGFPFVVPITINGYPRDWSYARFARNRAISVIMTRAHTVASIAVQFRNLHLPDVSIVLTTPAAPFCRDSDKAFRGSDAALLKAGKFVVDELEICTLFALVTTAALIWGPRRAGMCGQMMSSSFKAVNSASLNSSKPR